MATTNTSVADSGRPGEQGAPVSLGEAFWTWCRVAALSFGGPAGQIAVMHRIIVDEKKWISDERFLHALNYCMLLPGPEAQQLATYIGWLMHRTPGGLMAGTLFILPGAIAILALSIAYATYRNSGLVEGVFFGLKAAVMAIVFEAVLRIGKRVLKNSTMFALAAASFVAIFFFNLPFPVLILAAGLLGLIGGRIAPARFHVLGGANGGHDSLEQPQLSRHTLVKRSLVISSVCVVLWLGPVVALHWWSGPDSVFTQQGIFFSKAAVVTFGGAYSVLAYVAQQAVEIYGWLQPGEMLDGLGMAETTPGPLIMVVQFVGFMGAYRHPDGLEPLTAGVLGSLLTTWVTFVPCFLWILLGAPYMERLRGNQVLNSGLSAITAAVVGVVLNLAVWFALHTLFARVDTRQLGALRLQLPDFATLQWGVLAVFVLAFLLAFYWKRGMAVTLAICALVGAIVYSVQQWLAPG